MLWYIKHAVSVEYQDSCNELNMPKKYFFEYKQIKQHIYLRKLPTLDNHVWCMHMSYNVKLIFDGMGLDTS